MVCEALTLPLAPDDEVIVKVSIANVAERVCGALTLENVKVVTAPTGTPSTSTLATWWFAAGVIVNVADPPYATT